MEVKIKSGQKGTLEGKVIVLTRRNLPPPTATVWLCDATADKELLELATGLKIEDATPGGRLELAKEVIQYPVDVTRRASRRRFQAMLRGILASRLDCQRVGIITHSTLTSAAESLGAMFDERVAKVAYFGSGKDRGSNEWVDADCDLIIVAGTPRIPDLEIKKLLHRVGHLDALKSGGDWGDIRWQGFTPTDRPRIVTGRGYRDPLWRKVHQSKVRAAIVQAAGRSRALLETGCDAVILSTEECGFPVVEIGREPDQLGESEVRVLTALKDIASYISIKEQRPLAAHTKDIAERCAVTKRQVRRTLVGLESCRLVDRASERSGWFLSDAWQSSINQKYGT